MTANIKQAIALVVLLYFAIIIGLMGGDDAGKLNGKVLDSVRDFGASIGQVIDQ